MRGTLNPKPWIIHSTWVSASRAMRDLGEKLQGFWRFPTAGLFFGEARNQDSKTLRMYKGPPLYYHPPKLLSYPQISLIKGEPPRGQV